MSKLTVDQKTIKQLFENRNVDFLIPDYQRPYAWGYDECQTLWEDIFTFAFPDNDYSKFDSSSDEYFLGPIVTFLNEDKKQEVIDGQQRLTTLMLLLRAFYSKFGNMKDENSKRTKELIEKCIWKTNEFGEPDTERLKIDSEVATDNDKKEFLDILKTGDVEDKRSKYANNYNYFVKKIEDFLNEYPSYFSYLPTRILNNCILLPIEAESQDTALRIFSTLNDRGKPLSDADIFKAQFYKYYTSINKKDDFIDKWKALEEICIKIFHPIQGTPMDDIFTRYMYYERAKQGIRLSTTEALRKFYEKNSYILLRNEETFENLIILAKFWNDIYDQNTDRFSKDVLKQLFVLNYAPNGMWNYLVSVYFMANKQNNDGMDGMLDDKKFYSFLSLIIAFIWGYAFTNPGLNALRNPVYVEMINIVNNNDVEFKNFKFEKDKLRKDLFDYSFTNVRPITKSMLAWWAFNSEKQDLVPIETGLEIEHIYAKNRGNLRNDLNLELLGNKSLLEKRINIRASDYKFADKTKYYKGYINSKGLKNEGTKINELVELTINSDFTEENIISRNEKIINSFIEYLNKMNLLK